MILIPYFLDITPFDSKRFGIFLSNGGESFWEIDDTETVESVRATLEANGLPVLWLHPSNDKQVMYAEIDDAKLKINDFYLSTDIGISGKDVWKIMEIPTTVWGDPRFHEVFTLLTGYQDGLELYGV